MIANIVIDIAHHEVNKPFDYLIPKRLENKLQLGMRVKVSFHNALRLGVIIGFSHTSYYEELKEIEAIDTYAPILNQSRFDVMQNLVHNFAMTYHEALMLLTPLAFQMKFKYVITKIKDHPKLNIFQDKFLKNNTWTLQPTEIEHLSRLKDLEHLGIIDIGQQLFYKGSQSRRLAYQKVVQNHAKHQTSLDLLNIHETYSKSALLDLGLSSYTILKMVELDLIKKVDKTFIQEHIKAKAEPLKTYNRLFYRTHKIDFIHTLRGIIKTHQINHQSLLIIVPEIDMLKPLHELLDQIPLLYSSAFTSAKKIQLEQHVLNHPTIVLGTKRALFLEYKHLASVMILDAYHEAYDMQIGNHYHALEVASILYQDIQIMYQSPIMTTYLNHIKDLVQIKQHIQYKTPQIISMKQELIEGHTQMISRRLKEQITKTILNNKKVIILFQRKGYLAFHMCRMCGEVATCKSCHQTMQVLDQHTLFCNTCGTSVEMSNTCSNGHTNYMKPVGVGLDYAYQELLKLFPNYRLAKITKDIIPTEPFDILIGTQKVKDYLNDQVGLTAVLMADMLWNHNEYDTYEKAHQLIMMMSMPPNNQSYDCFIQTYDETHPVVLSLREPDTFILHEYRQRDIAMLPPFTKIFDIYMDSKSYLKSFKEALQLKEFFISHHIPVIGPRQDIFDQQFVLTLKITPEQELIFYNWMDTHTYHIERR